MIVEVLALDGHRRVHDFMISAEVKLTHGPLSFLLRPSLHRGRQTSIDRGEDLGREMQGLWLGCCPIGHLTGEHDPSRDDMAMPHAIEHEFARKAEQIRAELREHCAGRRSRIAGRGERAARRHTRAERAEPDAAVERCARSR